MNIMLNFMDKIYSDDKAMTMVYIVGSVLLFIFIVLLIFSLRKPSKKDNVNIIDEPKDNTKDEVKEDTKEDIINKEDEKKEETIEKTENVAEEVKKDETSRLDNNVVETENVAEDNKDTNIFEKTTIIPLENVKVNENELSKEENIEKALDNASKEHKITPEINEKIDDSKISTDIPNVDEFVDNVVKKTYEKNEQFSSVYVGDNTSTMKLDKVMDQVNMDKDVKKEITGVDNVLDDNEKIKAEESSLDIKEESASDLVKDEIPSKLDNLKEALEEKKEDELKKEEVKEETTAINKEDLLNKLNALKK